MVDGVGQQDAAALLAVGHPVPGGFRAHDTDDRVGLNRPDLAQGAFVQKTFYRAGVGPVTQVLGDHEGHTCFVGRFDHVPAVLERVRHRFLDDHVLAGAGGRNRRGGMLIVAGADVHRIDVGVAQHVIEVRVDGFDARSLRVIPRRRFDDIAHGGEPHPVRMLQVRGHVGVGNAPAAYHPDLQWLSHIPFSRVRSNVKA